jgi:multidrug resistance efflux pump
LPEPERFGLAFPEELTEAVTITRRSDWLILGTLAALLLAGILWSSIDTLPVTAQGEGILRVAGSITVVAPRPGVVSRICVDGGIVEAGTVLVEIYPGSLPVPEPPALQASSACEMNQGNRGPAIRVTAPFRARLVEVRAAPGDQVTTNMPLAILVPADQPLQAVLFVQSNLVGRIRAGMPVQLTSETSSTEKGGYIFGRVSHVPASPESDAGLRQLLDEERLIRDCIVRGLRLRVDVSLDEHENHHSTLPTAQDLKSDAPLGATIVGDILLAREHPIVWLVHSAQVSGSE